MTKGLEDMNYYYRLGVLNMTMLEMGCVQGDITEAFNTSKKFEDVNSNLFFKRSELGLRGHKFKLVKPRA